MLERLPPGATFEVSCVEVYCEEAYDLLDGRKCVKILSCSNPGAEAASSKGKKTPGRGKLRAARSKSSQVRSGGAMKCRRWPPLAQSMCPHQRQMIRHPLAMSA